MLEVVASLFFVFLIGSIAIAKNRGAAILIIAVLSSSMLGLLDPLSFAIKGVFDVHAIFIVFFTFLILSSASNLKQLKDSFFLYFCFAYFIFWLVGVLLPIINDHSSLFYAIKASKEFMMFLSYFAIFLFIRNISQLEFAWKILIYWSLYYSVLELLAQALGANLQNYIKYFIRPEPPFFWKLYPPFWPVILISLLHTYYDLVVSRKNALLQLSTLFVGLAFTFFRSYLLATFATIPLLLFVSKIGATKTLLRILILLTISTTAIVIVSFWLGKGIDSFNELTDDFVFSGIRELQENKGGSIEGRAIYAEERKELLKQSPYIGFGFIDKDSLFGQNIKNFITGDMLSFIDKGDIDIKLKFGNIGFGILNLLYLVYIGKIIIFIRTKKASNKLKVRLLTIASTMLIYQIVQPVHSAMTHSFGLLPLFIALALTDKQYCLENKRDYMSRKKIIQFSRHKLD